MTLDRDTIGPYDSLTGLIGCVFTETLDEERRRQVINSLSYRIDTTNIELSADAEFFKTKRINDTTFRFAFLPLTGNPTITEKPSFYASIKVHYRDKHRTAENYTFTNQFYYSVRRK